MTTIETSKATTPRALAITVSERSDQLAPTIEASRTVAGMRLLAVSVLLAGTAYLAWRVAVTLSPASALLGIPLVILESWSLVSLGLATVALWDLDHSRRPAEMTHTAKRIAVVIPTTEEPHQVLMPVLAAAARMRLASEIVVLDDGRREWLTGMCDELGIGYRTRTVPSDGLAGQLNTVLPTLSADFVVVLDADQVADRDFIGRTLGHFEDPRIACVQTDRDVYTADSFEHVTRGKERFAEHSLFERMIAAGRNRWSAAVWNGGGAMLRVSALDSLGGVVEGFTSPGVATSLALHRAGWRTVHHNEVLARGRAAADAADFADRRAAECHDAMTLLRRGRVARGHGLSLGQRVSYLTSLGAWLDAWRTLGYLVLPPLALMFTLTPAAGPVSLFVLAFCALFVLRHATVRLLGRGHSPMLQPSVFTILRMAATLPATVSLITGRAPSHAAATERDARRVPRLLWILCALNALALAWAVASLAGAAPGQHPYPLFALLAATWTGANIAIVFRAASRIRSTEFGGDRRAAHRIEVEGHLYLDGSRVHVLDLSLTGVRILSYGLVPELGAYCALTFTDPNRRPAVITGTVEGIHRRPHGHEVRVGFEANQTYVTGAILADALIRSA